MQRYTRDFLLRELEIMPEWFLRRHLGHTPTCAEWDVLEAGFTTLLHNALAQPQGFVHRDYHSRNLLIVPHDQPQNIATRLPNPGIIDYQGALIGPITYDLASLLRDCYIAWDRQRVEAWADGYRLHLQTAQLIDGSVDRGQFLRWFDLTGLQRHIKVLGIFCRLCYRDNKPGYLDDLPRVYDYVIDVAARYPELADFAALLQRCVGMRDLRQVTAA